MAATAAETETAAFRRSLVAGAAVVVLGGIWDTAWHSRNPGLEAGADMVQAHAVIYLGLAIVVVSAAWALHRFSLRRPTFLAALLGGVVAALGHALDVYAHSSSSESGLGHALILVGQAVVIVTAFLVLTSRRRRRDQPI